MRAVLIGDIIDSRTVENPRKWIAAVKRVLGRYGKSPRDWEIFRGDSFQLETDAENGFAVLYQLKAALKSLDLLDARISIGIGEVQEGDKMVKMRSGPAFVYSGEAFDTLKTKKRTMVFNCADEMLRREMNMLLQLSEVILSGWTESSAIALDKMFESPGISQTELASKLKITQPSISSRLKVAHAEEIFDLIDYYTYRIKMAKV